MGTSTDTQRDQELQDAKRFYDNHMSNTLWSLHNAIRMMQRRKRLSIGANREKYERMFSRLSETRDRVYSLSDDVFETEDDVMFSEQGESIPVESRLSSMASQQKVWDEEAGEPL
jgi:hypothetical protein